MDILVSIIIIFAILCMGPAILFFVGGRLFGAMKEEQWLGFKRSVLGILWFFGIFFALPCIINLVMTFLHNVVWGSMTLREYSKHIEEFSLRAVYNYYTQLFSKLSRL